MAGWTDYHSDWSTVDKIRLADDAVLDACIAAGRERYVGAEGVGATWDGFFSKPAGRGAMWRKLLEELLIIVPSYVNHADSGGDWSDKAAVVTWTESTIATAAGLGAWPSADRIDENSAALPKAVYGICNLLRWYFIPLGPRAAQRKTRRSSANGWAAAVALFNATPWGGWGSLGIANHNAQDYWGVGYYTIDRGAHRWGAISAPSTLSYKLDAYCLLTAWPSNVYEDNDYNTSAAERLARIFNDATERNGDLPAYSLVLGDFGDATATQPSGTNMRGWSHQYYHRPRLIYKYDVTGGFDFVAP